MKTQLKLMLLIIAVSLIVFTGCKKQDLPVATTIEQGSVFREGRGSVPGVDTKRTGICFRKSSGSDADIGCRFF